MKLGIRCAALISASALAAPCHAQCLSWSHDFSGAMHGLGGTSPDVRVMQEFDDGSGPALYVAGSFSTAGGIPVTNLAKWNGSGWTSLPGMNGIMDMKVYDDGTGPGLFAAGQFTGGLAKWNGSGWSIVGGGLNQNAAVLEVHDGKLFVAGVFTQAGGTATDRIAAWNGTSWTRFSGGPSMRQGHAMTFDAARGKTILFGGTPGSTFDVMNDTWEFDGTSWTQVASTGPGRRRDGLFAFDTLRSRSILLAGQLGPSVSDPQTWAWDGTAWSPIAVSPQAAYRKGCKMVYDIARDRLVVVGGEASCCTNIQYDETWEFDGTTWSQATPLASPGTRTRFGMAYDAARGKTVLFGGYRWGDGLLGDTWEYDGSTWTLVSMTGPSPREQFEMAYDSAAGTVILYGGIADSSGPKRETWSWNGSTWSLLSAGNPTWAERKGPMVYDAANDQLVQQSQLRTTWVGKAGVWNPLASGGVDDGEVFALKSWNDGTDSALYVGGNFSNVGGSQRRGIARLGTTGWSTHGSLPGSVNALEVFDAGSGPRLYAGGNFTSPLNSSLAVFSGGSWSPDNGLGSSVHDLLVFNDGSGDALYASGTFTRVISTIPRGGIARLNGSQWDFLESGLHTTQDSLRVRKMSAFSLEPGSLYVGGNFTHAGANDSRCIARWGDQCIAPFFMEEAQIQTGRVWEPVNFTAKAVGGDPITYQWRKDGVPLSNTPLISGVNTTKLSIGAWTLSDAGFYDCVATNPYGTATSLSVEFVVPGTGSPSVQLTPIVLPPQAIDTLPSETWTHTFSAVAARDGDVAFHAQVSTGHRAIGVWRDDETSLLVREGLQVPGLASGVLTSEILTYAAGSNQTVAAGLRLTGSGVNSSNNTALLVDRDGTSDIVARTGDQVPGLPTGVVWYRLGREAEIKYPRANGAGRVAFSAQALGPSYPYRTGYWVWNPLSGVNLAALVSQSAPGTATTFKDMGDSFDLDENSTLTFDATIDSKTGYKSNAQQFDTGIWRGTVGDIEPMVRSGDAAPGVVAGANFDVVYPNGWVISPAGSLLFSSSLAGPDQYTARSLYRLMDGTLEKVAVSGQNAPGTDPAVPFSFPIAGAVNDMGRAIFTSSLNPGSCTTCPRWGTWLADEYGITPIFLDRQSVSFTHPGTSLIAVGSPLAINGASQAVMSATVDVGYTEVGVVGWTYQTGLFAIAIPGTQIELSEGVYKSVLKATLANSDPNSDDGRTTGLTDDGVTVLRILFMDGTTGIFTAKFEELLRAAHPCRSDFDLTGFVDTDDFDAFVEAFEAGHPSADVDMSGFVDTEDFDTFVHYFELGC
jgi:hypothetical protein